MVGTAYACSLGSPGHALQDAWEARIARLQASWRHRMAGGGVGRPIASPCANRSGRSASRAPGSEGGVHSDGSDSGKNMSGVSGQAAFHIPAALQLAAASGDGAAFEAMPVGPSPRRRANVV